MKPGLPYICAVKFKTILVYLLLFMALLTTNVPVSAQCAMCKSNLEKARENGGTPVGNTLNAGILYLLVLPYAIAGVFGAIYYRKYKQAKQLISKEK